VTQQSETTPILAQGSNREINTPPQGSARRRHLDWAAQVTAFACLLSLLACGGGPSLAERTREAAESGDVTAQYNLGLMNLYGDGVAESATEAAAWFLKAGEQEHDEAQYSLAKAYLNGEGVQKDLAEAEKWYRQSANQGNAEAQFRLARLLHEDDLESESAKWYLAAAEQYHPAAQFRLGDMYRTRARTKDDMVEACFWLLLSGDFDDRAHSQYKEMVRSLNDRGEFLVDRFQIKTAKARYYAFLEKNRK